MRGSNRAASAGMPPVPVRDEEDGEPRVELVSPPPSASLQPARPVRKSDPSVFSRLTDPSRYPARYRAMRNDSAAQEEPAAQPQARAKSAPEKKEAPRPQSAKVG